MVRCLGPLGLVPDRPDQCALCSATRLIVPLFKVQTIFERHGGAVGSALGFASKHPSSKLGRDNCVEALSLHRVTAGGKLLTLICLGGDWLSFTFILTIVIERLRFVSCL